MTSKFAGPFVGQEYLTISGVRDRVYSIDWKEREITLEILGGLSDEAEDSGTRVGDHFTMSLDEFLDDIGRDFVLETDIPERDWLVSWGYYCDRRAYRGPSTFLAGLNYARVHRKGCRIDVAGRGYDVQDQSDLDECGDNKTDEEQDFFDRCAAIGAKFQWRDSFDHSKNWKSKEEWAALKSASGLDDGEFWRRAHTEGDAFYRRIRRIENDVEEGAVAG